MYYESRPQSPEEDAAEELNGCLAALFINACMLFSPHPYDLIAIAWPLLGIAWFITSLNMDAKRYNSSKWTELLIALRLPLNCFYTIYLWPFSALLTLCKWGPTSYRDQLEHEILREMIFEVAPTSGHDSAIFASRRRFASNVKATEAASERMQQMPHEIALGAKTACASGAIVATMAARSASAEEPAKLPAPAVSASTYGWVTVVAQSPSAPAGVSPLKMVRIRNTITVNELKTALFTEIDAAALQYEDPDWLKQCFSTTSVSKALKINVGRMAVGPIWLSPPPFLHEMVNYPRLPFSLIAPAVEADIRSGPMRIILDVSGATGYKFSDERQFDRLEGDVRIEYAASKTCTLGLTSQASGEFLRSGFDVALKPTPQSSLRAAVYHGDDWKNGSSVDGAYAFGVLRPFSSHPEFELHGQADWQHRSNGGDSAIMTVGARVLLMKGSHSITLDREQILSRNHSVNDTTWFLRWQTRF